MTDRAFAVVVVVLVAVATATYWAGLVDGRRDARPALPAHYACSAASGREPALLVCSREAR